MMITKESILKLKAILEKECGHELSYEYAEESAYNLMNFYEVLFRIAAKEKEQSQLSAPKG